MKKWLSTLMLIALLAIMNACTTQKKEFGKMSDTIKIIAYNVEFAKATTPAAVALHLKPENPDIICFSEVPNGAWTALVGKQLGMDYCYVGKVASANHGKKYPDKTGKFSGKFKAILSRTPLTGTHEKLLQGTGWSPVSAVFARTTINDKPLLIGSLHIPSGVKDPLNSCSAHLAKLMTTCDDSRIIITGDYNDRANSAPMQPLYRQGFKNSWLTTNYKLKNEKTWDAKSEKDAGVIDHILYRGTLKAIDTGIIKSDTPPADHYAIFTTFLLN